MTNDTRTDSVPTAAGEADTAQAPVAMAGTLEPEAAQLDPILTAALHHIALHGYHATSVRMIAREVGVTVPALYYHYENKQAMLVALLDSSVALAISYVERALAAAGTDPVSRLQALVKGVALYSAHHRDLAILDSERRSLTEENLARYAAHRDSIESRLHEIVEDGVAQGLFATPAPRNCVRAILSMTQGITGWFRPDGPRTAEETAHDYERIALAAVEYRDL